MRKITEITTDTGYLYFRINRNHPYRIHKSALNEDITVQYPSRELVENAPIFQNISNLIYHIMTTKNIEGDIIDRIKLMTLDLYPDNTINWDNTDKFIKYYMRFEERYAQLYIKKKSFASNVFETLGERAEEREEIRAKVVEELKEELKNW